MSGSKSSGVGKRALIRPTTEELVTRYEHDCALRNMTPITIQKQTNLLRAFSRWSDGKGIHILDLNKDDVRAYIEYLKFERRITRRSIENQLCALSGLCDLLEYEGMILMNPIPAVRRRYMRAYKEETHTHKAISNEEMATLIRSAADIRDRTMMAVMAKCGLRRNELISLDASDVNLDELTITLKPTAKRSNRIVYFDNETEILLRRWFKARENRNKTGHPALFISRRDGRLGKGGVDKVIVEHAERLGLYNTQSDKLEDHYTSHCFRHWFTTALIRAGMPRDYIKELRGDARKEAIDVYNHIDRKELRESYLAHIPQLGI